MAISSVERPIQLRNAILAAATDGGVFATWRIDPEDRIYHTLGDWAVKEHFEVTVDKDGDVAFLW